MSFSPMLQGKKIVVGITGSIAAYKSVYLVRGLIKKGAEVRVVMTPSATQFVTPLTFSTLSKQAVYSKIMEDDAWNDHVELGLWADLMLIAPLTAGSMAKMANGLCDNVVLAVWLSAKCETFIAPAMDRDMWLHPATKQNVEKLQSFGTRLIPVVHGELASGLVGEGRMAEPEDIIQHIENYFTESQAFTGKNVLITAGPTYEVMDPVRFIGNHSSGKMGVALANIFSQRGASVKIILGPTRFSQRDVPACTLISVQSAAEMYDACLAHAQQSDILIFAAAVADYRPKVVSKEKLKKTDATFSLELERTVDIAASLGADKRSNQIHVGFALETEQETVFAKGKLEKKNFDMIVMNSLRDEGAGFQHDTNKVTFFFKDSTDQALPLMSKELLAGKIADAVLKLM